MGKGKGKGKGRCHTHLQIFNVKSLVAGRLPLPRREKCKLSFGFVNHNWGYKFVEAQINKLLRGPLHILKRRTQDSKGKGGIAPG